ncbi:MAG TPA: SusD/RagB family nutrient-binding outer membrane lipoprotein [Puia sp.]
MKRISASLLICSLLTLLSCSKAHFSNMNVNPDQSADVPPYLLLPNIAVKSFTLVTPNHGNEAIRSHQAGDAQQPYTEQYWNWLQGDFSAYNTLLQVHLMKLEAAKYQQPQFDAVAKFFDAYNFYKATMLFGDIPFSQAEQAGTGTYNPVYDPQKNVFLGILNELDSANTELIPYSDGKSPLTGDVIYGSTTNDVMQWRRLINSFTLRVLVTLSGKTADADLQVVSRFQKIYNNPATYPIFQSNADNGALSYYNQNGNIYPLYKNTEVTRLYPDSAFCTFLTTNKDPRLFAWFAPTANATAAGKQPTDFTAYKGIDASIANTPAANLFTQTGTISGMNIRYTANPAPEPYVAVGYPELQFNLAEAAFRGWITANPETFYKNGIQASMSFYEPYENLPGGTYQTAAYFPTYYAQPAITYNPATALQQIIYQKYVSFFYNSYEEPYFNMRRTGLPVITLNGGGMQNGGKLPLRFLYPISETQTNGANLNDALTRQFPGGKDDINAAMWLLK